MIKEINSTLKVLILKTMLLVFAISVFHFETQAAQKCSNALFDAVPIGALRPEFDHTVRYTKEIPQSRITNQCNLGTCHLYSWSNHLEANYLRRTGKEIRLSADYLSYIHFFASSIAALSRTNKDVKLSLGASSIKSFELIKQYGLRPESSFNIGPEFKAGVPSARANAMIENYIARVQLELSKIQDPTKKQKAFVRRVQELDSLFKEMFGDLPNNFQVEGKTYNARTFTQEFFPELKEKIAVYQVQHRAKEKYQKVQETNTQEVYDIDRRAMDELIISQIDQGKNVYLSYEHKHELVDKPTGIMSIEAFNIPIKMLPLPLNRRQQFKLDDGGHAVQIVGYELNPFTKELVKVKIKNSWGEKNGDAGYFHMYRDYLHTFVKSVVTLP
ncbi:C1 family peptidase [Bdellovibrio svalbardensis]|uniref:Aminopeptidase n=1 Tax=Bdellovibrio svalbardensis TaxID=2972972 RepID=A0ABT6DGD2_9BACT|nr:C1 family peptidase [Bdellovibrio svalbardensis]MDG0815537.1 hypothetical protein [Bdellovibrio svalbardensis]